PTGGPRPPQLAEYVPLMLRPPARPLNVPALHEINTLSLHDALPILQSDIRSEGQQSRSRTTALGPPPTLWPARRVQWERCSNLCSLNRRAMNARPPARPPRDMHTHQSRSKTHRGTDSCPKTR